MGKDIPAPWLPEQDLVRLATYGKLGEELGELQAIVSRCVIQGIDAYEPETLKRNRDALQEEVADAYAALTIVLEVLALDPEVIMTRRYHKIQHLRRWHQLIRGVERYVHYATEPCEADTIGGDVWKGPGWYFWTETQADRIGPFTTREIAGEAFARYEP